MMNKSQESGTEDFLLRQQNDIQTNLSTERRPEQSLADELGLAAEGLTWSRKPELKECEAMAEAIAAEGYYDMADLADASANERTQLSKRLAAGRAGRARALRKILDSKQLATEIETEKTPAYKEIDILAATKRRKHLSGLTEILIPNQEAANLVSAELRSGKRALSPYTPFLPPFCSNGPAKMTSFGVSELARKRSSRTANSCPFRTCDALFQAKWPGLGMPSAGRERCCRI